ncbi:type II toxin-antitoxin system RelE/ParE family toxin [Terriglobus sp. RCC_193]|uniref:type II toxin-antitoxin system RelE/ParE family toxin n=1 Tax=Terriglobus sp. RCC_193 TaxID=3239218 RepID=UPI0035237A62
MKRYEVLLTERAERELKSIWVYVRSRFSTEAADRFIQEVRSGYLELETAPFRGHIRVRDIREIGVAQRRVTINFRVQNETVTVVAIRYRGRQH